MSWEGLSSRTKILPGLALVERDALGDLDAPELHLEELLDRQGAAPVRVGDEDERDALGGDDPRQVPVGADDAGRRVDLRAIARQHPDQVKAEIRARPRRPGELARQRAAPDDERAPQEPGALGHLVVGDAPRRDDERGERDRDEEDAPADLERRDDVEDEEKRQRPEDDPAQRPVVDGAGVAGVGEIVEARVVEGRLDHQCEEQRLLGDVGHRQAAAHAEAQARGGEQGHGDERPLVTEEEQPSRRSKELDHGRSRDDDGVAELQRDVLLQVAALHHRVVVEGNAPLAARVAPDDDDAAFVGEPREAARERQPHEDGHLVARRVLAGLVHLADHVESCTTSPPAPAR